MPEVTLPGSAASVLLTTLPTLLGPRKPDGQMRGKAAYRGAGVGWGLGLVPTCVPFLGFQVGKKDSH